MNYNETRNDFAELLDKYDLTIGVAEFGTNGEITRAMHDRFDDQTFHGGLVCYSAKAVHNILGVCYAVPVKSKFAASEMAERVRRDFIADIAVSAILCEGEAKAPCVLAGFLIGTGEFNWKYYEVPEADREDLVLQVASMRILREMERQVVEYYGK
ncbi:MAG: CinA family protein [Firmicutes bacterium]|nr:CinA family protein [Bacillota bacterium]